jgi:DNA-binding response OmpR family regulator
VVDAAGERATGQSHPSPRPEEMLVCGCHRDDVAVLERAVGSSGPSVRAIDKPAEMAREAVKRLPLAVFLGLRKHDRARLQIIPLLRAAWKELPVIVVADEGSLELERKARQAGIFYYFVHPLGHTEVQAVLKDLLRRARRGTAANRPDRDLPKKRSES